MKPTTIIFLCALSYFFISCNYKPSESSKQVAIGEATWISLFNESDLNNWNTYLGPEIDDEGEKFGEPGGLNNDPRGVFTVVEADGKPAIRISGEIGGGLSTKESYKNYHLTLEFKWGAPSAWKIKPLRDSGLLYHAGGPYGADWDFWMRSQEFQIQEGDCGDYWGVAGGAFDIPAVPNDDSSAYVFDPHGEALSFHFASKYGRHCIKNPVNEKPTGEWNSLELYCMGDTSVHVMNGQVNMVLYNSRYLKDGDEIPLTEGKIEFQSEGAEIFLRNIRLRNIEQLPEGLR